MNNVDLSDVDIIHLKQIRNYFGEHDVSMFEHKAYAVLDNILKRIVSDEKVDGITPDVL